jgi:hypothetical protein
MTLAPFAVALTLLTTGLLQQPAAAPGQLRWVRGVVSVASPGSIVVNFRDRSVTLSIDASTRMLTTPAAGAVVEAHYTEDKPGFRAALIVEALSPDVSKRPGRSYRGTVTRVRRSTLSLRVDGKNRSVQLESRELKELANQLAAGEEVLVAYDEQSDDIPAGDITISGTKHVARDIRRLR